MPRKINKRKAIQAAKLKAQAEAEAKRNRRWPGTRRRFNEGPQEPLHIGTIAHSGAGLALISAMVTATILRRPHPQEASHDE